MDIKIGTFNIQHGRDHLHYINSGEEIIDLTKVSDAIKSMELDICGLNEVRNQENVEGLCNQVKVIAENLGYYYYIFAKAIDNRGGGYGNALVSKYPIEHFEFIPISVDKNWGASDLKYEDRVLLCADILVNGKILNVLVTHFGLNHEEKAKAIDIVEDCVKKYDGPVIFMGDLNIEPNTEHYRKLRSFLNDTADFGSNEMNTFPSHDPNKKIDYLFYNDLCHVTEAFVPNVVVSDHRPYVVNISV